MCVCMYRYVHFQCICVCVLRSPTSGPSNSAEGDIKSPHNYHPTFKELQSGALLWAVEHLKEA